MPPPDPLDRRERQSLKLTLLVLGHYGRLGAVEPVFERFGARALAEFGDEAEDIFDYIYAADPTRMPDPVDLPPVERAALAQDLRAQLGAELALNGHAKE